MEGDPDLERAAQFVRARLGRPLSPGEARDPCVLAEAVLESVARSGSPLDPAHVEAFVQAAAALLERLIDEVLQTACLLLDRGRLLEEAIALALLLSADGRRRGTVEPWLFALVNDVAQRLRYEEDAARPVSPAQPFPRPWLVALAHEMNLLEYPERSLVWGVLVERRPAADVAAQADLPSARVEALIADILERADRRARRGGGGRTRDEEDGDAPAAGEADHE